MDLESKKYRLELVTVVLGVLGAVVALVGYLQSKSEAAEAAQRASEGPYYERQLTLYLDAVELASQIARPSSPQERTEATSHFWQLYWGKMCFVEDPMVEKAMVEFGKELLKIPAVVDATASDELSTAAYDLAHHLRDAVKSAWPVSTGGRGPKVGK